MSPELAYLSLKEAKRDDLVKVIEALNCTDSEKLARLRHIGYLSFAKEAGTISNSLPETATGEHPRDRNLEKVA